jgi:hypothetical protein
MLGHVMGLPVEEGVLQVAPVAAAMLTATAMAGRTTLGRLRRRLRAGERRSPRHRAGA